MIKEKETSVENIVHHIYHKEGEDEYKREVHIGGATCNISIASSNPVEDINFLCSKTLELYRKIRDGDKL